MTVVSIIITPVCIYYVGIKVALFSSKISIFYKISVTPFDKAQFQLSESVLQITVR